MSLIIKSLPAFFLCVMLTGCSEPTSVDRQAMQVRCDKQNRLADIYEGNTVVLRYHYGINSVPPGVDPNYARGDYISRLYGLDGQLLTEDYPPDHLHHRAINWSWATVEWKGRQRDLFAVRGIRAWPVNSLKTHDGPDCASINAQSRWKWDDNEPIVDEKVTIKAYKQIKQGRCIDFEIRLTALVNDVRFCGRLKQAYSGFNLRMAPAQGQQILFQSDLADPNIKGVWADYSADFDGKGISGVAVLQNKTNPLYPGGWIKYPQLNFFQPVYPGGQLIPMPKGRTITLKYRLWVHRGKATPQMLSDLWTAYNSRLATIIQEPSK